VARLVLFGSVLCGEYAERVGVILRDICSGGWRPWLSPPVAFGPAGLLTDGHHRLAAVVLSGRACWQRVTWPGLIEPCWVLVTPQLAERWLSLPGGVATCLPHRAAAMSAAMSAPVPAGGILAAFGGPAVPADAACAVEQLTVERQ